MGSSRDQSPMAHSEGVMEEVPAGGDGTRPPQSRTQGSDDSAKSTSTVKRASNALTPSAHTGGTSPATSREASPSGQQRSVDTAVRARSKRSGRGQASERDSETPSNVAAAVERALGTSTPPSLRPTIVGGQLPAETDSQSTDRGLAGSKTPYRIKTARLKSPPPSASSAQAALLSGQPSPSPAVIVQRPASGSNSPATAAQGGNDAPSAFDLDSQPAASGMRTPVRAGSVTASGLETVQESSLPSTPAIDLALQGRKLGHRAERGEDSDGQAQKDGAVERKESVPTKPNNQENKTSAPAPRKSTQAVAPNSSAHITRSSNAPPTAAHAALNAKGKGGPEGAVQSMTVETETVSSVPQLAVGGGAGERGGASRAEAGGSLRLRPSLETVRPRKEKKKSMRKTPSLISGAGTSKADIFEARVASAVDEANSSDSEETFVYESNPPEPHSTRPGRHHSRTPSSTSVQSQMEQRAAMLANHNLVGKRSMKFASNAYVGPLSDQEGGAGFDGPAFGRGSGRGGGQGAVAHHHHHIGHWGRAGRAPQVMMFEPETSFLPGHRPSRTGTAGNSHQSSRATSPRDRNHLRLSTSTGKRIGQISTYDLDVESVDDERTPLVGSVRVSRRRPTDGSHRGYATASSTGWLARFAGCLALTTIILLIIVGAIGFFAATAKPLVGLQLRDISNVIATEQELMLDLGVVAINPNIVSITVEQMDVNIFAKSKRAGGDSQSVRYRTPRVRLSTPGSQAHETLPLSASPSEPVSMRRSRSEYHISKGIDEGTDPMPDPKADSHTMLLGRIFSFDSAPTFDGSPLAHRPSASVGEVRLEKPGNRTEEGGTARWERVLQHPFELIVRGVLKYQLPLSGRVRTAPIGGSILVHPELGIDATGTMMVEPLHDKPGPPGSNSLTEQVALHPPPLR